MEVIEKETTYQMKLIYSKLKVFGALQEDMK